MLQVAIHRDDDVALGFVEAGGEGGGLAEVAAQADHLEVAVGFHQVGQEFETAVVRGVVDEEDFVGALQLLQNCGEAVVQREYGGLLVVDRNHDRQHCHAKYQCSIAPARLYAILRRSMDRIPFQATAGGALYEGIRTLPLAVLLDNVRSMYNVGAFFRTADAASVEKLYLCGITARPPKKAIAKTALGAQDTVPWEHSWDPLPLLESIRARGYEIAAVETSVHAVDLFDWQPRFPVCVVFGHEVDGIRPEISALCDTYVRIPMLGTKHSLNVATAGGVVIYELLRKYRALGLR